MHQILFVTKAKSGESIDAVAFQLDGKSGNLEAGLPKNIVIRQPPIGLVSCADNINMHNG